MMLQGVDLLCARALVYVTSRAAKVLIVEDDLLIRRFLTDNLAADGYTPLQAGSLGQAREVLATGAPDLAVLDLGLPDGDGLSLIAELRDDEGPFGNWLPVVVLSGRAGELDRVRGPGAGGG